MRKKLFLILGLGLLLSPWQLNSGEALKVAILGTGKKSGLPEYYSAENFAKVVDQIKIQKPDLVLFNGNLIQGLEQSTTPESLREFETNLMAFSQSLSVHLGNTIPVYALMGNHSLVNSQAVTLFQNHFNIKDKAPLEPYQLAYSIKLKNVQFTFLVTGLYEAKFRDYGIGSRSMPLLDWLEKNVRTSFDEVDFHFIVGHEPAYSSTASEGIYSGLDQISETRDRFWNILKNNHVRGYFCSHELMYDRSNHKGVWQLISGGVGDPQRIPEEQTMFRHFILLSIPENKHENPTLKAIDIYGKVWDEFQMIPTGEPVHHLRISQN